MSTLTRQAHTAMGTETVLVALLSAGVDLAISSTDYWTVTLRRFASDAVFGEEIAVILFKDYGLTAFTSLVMYRNARGFDLDEGDRLVLYAVSTGSPSTPTDLTCDVLIQGR